MEIAISLLSLTLMEIVLGIDNIIFISIIVSRLAKPDQGLVRSLGIVLALLMRIILLFSLAWIMSLTKPWLQLWRWEFSGRDLVLLVGGLFLIVKSTLEIHENVSHVADHTHALPKKNHKTMKSAILQIVVLDIIFSLDSVITAVGMVKEMWIMITAMVVSMIVMLVAAKSISEFVENNPTIKMLALSFLLLIGFTLVVEGTGVHVSKSYIYFAMFFSLSVELLNLRVRKLRSA